MMGDNRIIPGRGERGQRGKERRREKRGGDKRGGEIESSIDT